MSETKKQITVAELNGARKILALRITVGGLPVPLYRDGIQFK
jgi:hypothetical protein